MRTPLVLSQWSTVSPFGMGQTEFVQGLRDGAAALTPVDTDTWSTPDSQAGLVPGFNVREAFGAKGTRALDRATGLAMKTVEQLLDQLAGGIGSDREVGLVLGTTAGSVQSAMDFVKDSFVQARPFQVDPSRFPNAVMNRAAGQCAIWHGLRGPNATIAGGRAAGLLALKYGARLHRRTRARTVLCGAVEEYSEQRAWMDWHTGGETRRPLGEGCAMFALETAHSAQQAGRTPLAELVSISLGVWSVDDPAGTVLTTQLRRALDGIGGRTQSVRAVVVGGGASSVGLAEAEALRNVFADVPQVTVDDLLGDTGAASAGFQLAAALSTPGTPHQPYVAVTSVDSDGVVGCAVVRIL